MGTRVSYPVEVKMKAIEIDISGELQNKFYKNRLFVIIFSWKYGWNGTGELHHLKRPVGKQYTYDKGGESFAKLQTGELLFKAANWRFIKVSSVEEKSSPKNSSTAS